MSFPKEDIRLETQSRDGKLCGKEKRKFGDELMSKLLKMQRREMKVIDIVYNIHRYLSYSVSVFVGFLQSPALKSL
jgi:hypothetical protein